MNKKLIFLLAIVALWSCGDDDEGGSTDVADLNDLEGFWTTDAWVTGPGGSTGLLTIELNAVRGDGEITALSANDWGFTCGEQTFRDLEPVDFDSFAGESLIRFVGGTFEWVPTTITLVSTDQIAIVFDCGSCSNQALPLNRLSAGTSPVIVIDEDIDVPTTLVNVVCDPTQPDYLVTDLIDVDELLTIEPGVTIAFDANAGLNINQFSDGAIVAQGTAVDPITFTGSTKTKGFWAGIIIETNDVRNELDYVIVEYAGSDIIADDIKSGVRGGIAVDVEPGSEVSSLKLTNSIVRENDGYGLIMEWFSRLREFSNNTFENNTDAAVLTEALNVGALDAESNYTGGNGYEGVEIHGTSAGNQVTTNATWPAFDDGSSYYVSSDIEIRAVLTIQPGATFEFEANQEILFHQDQFGPEDGAIIAQGTASLPITFTGFSKTPGYWKGINIESSSTQNSMEFCIVEFGGSDPIAGSLAANIGLN
ncbi:MAG: hypothetical protein AAFN93_24090, partial [Bacteroidota bacterium]